MPVPVLGRMSPWDYFALVGFFAAAVVETFVRLATLWMPNFLFKWLYKRSESVFNFLSSSSNRQQQSIDEDRTSKIHDAQDFVSICAISGYYAEEHVVQTKDGYLLGVHRLCFKKGEDTSKRVNTSSEGLRKKVVYLHHGLLMNSEVWVCLTDEKRCLPYALVEKGFDVWLGNNRGNKYSKKAIHCKADTVEFWDFSMDEFAFRDIPDTIDYILSATHSKSLSYIGFSQGTAQAFAALSVHPPLNEKVNLYLALAPAMSPAGLAFGVVDAIVKASPNLLFLLFGRKSILGSATMWQEVLYPPLWVRVIDVSLTFLFNWTGVNIPLNQKIAAYSHLYSFTSTKSVVHWFQIMRSTSFQMYDDEGARPFRITGSAKYYKVARYPTQNIKVPILLLWGGKDSLVDIKTMLKELPHHTKDIEVPHYEHLDFLWASGVQDLVFPHVFRALDLHSNSSQELNLTPPKPVRVLSADDSNGDLKMVNGHSKNNESRRTSGKSDKSMSKYTDAEKARTFDYILETLGEGEVKRRIRTPSSPNPPPMRQPSALLKASQASTMQSTTGSSPPFTPQDKPASVNFPQREPGALIFHSGPPRRSLSPTPTSAPAKSPTRITEELATVDTLSDYGRRNPHIQGLIADKDAAEQVLGERKNEEVLADRKAVAAAKESAFQQRARLVKEFAEQAKAAREADERNAAAIAAEFDSQIPHPTSFIADPLGPSFSDMVRTPQEPKPQRDGIRRKGIDPDDDQSGYFHSSGKTMNSDAISRRLKREPSPEFVLPDPVYDHTNPNNVKAVACDPIGQGGDGTILMPITDSDGREPEYEQMKPGQLKSLGAATTTAVREFQKKAEEDMARQLGMENFSTRYRPASKLPPREMSVDDAVSISLPDSPDPSRATDESGALSNNGSLETPSPKQRDNRKTPSPKQHEGSKPSFRDGGIHLGTSPASSGVTTSEAGSVSQNGEGSQRGGRGRHPKRGRGRRNHNQSSRGRTERDDAQA